MMQDVTGRRRRGSGTAGQADGWEGYGRHNRRRPAGGLRVHVVTQELVNQTADKVYAMLIHDLRIEEERTGSSRRKPFAEQGGW